MTAPVAPLERTLEAILTAGVRRLGGVSVKLAPTAAGLPDRLVLLPDGAAYLIELKSSGGRVRPIQRVMHERMASLGHPVVVLRGAEAVRGWLAATQVDGGEHRD